jgi:CRISPR/Cas system-associated endonuclease Cas3-HD
MSEQLRRGKKTLFKKAHKLAKVHDIDIAVIMHKWSVRHLQVERSRIVATNYEADCKSKLLSELL